MAVLRRIVLSVLPLALTPLFFLLLADGYVNLGGGEKDIIVLVPWVLWSLVYAIGCWIFWAKGLATAHGAGRAALIAVIALLSCGVLLFGASALGFA